MLVVCKHAVYYYLPVNELVKNNNVTRLNLLSKGPTGCGNQKVGTALFLQGPNVCLVVYISGHYSMLSAMPEGDKAIMVTIKLNASLSVARRWH